MQKFINRNSRTIQWRPKEAVPRLNRVDGTLLELLDSDTFKTTLDKQNRFAARYFVSDLAPDPWGTSISSLDILSEKHSFNLSIRVNLTRTSSMRWKLVEIA